MVNRSRRRIYGSEHLKLSAFIALFFLSLALSIQESSAGTAVKPDESSKSAQTKAAAPANKSASAAKTPAQSTQAKPKALDFSAVWCVPCKKFSPLFDKVGKNYKGRVDFLHYDVESKDGEVLAEKYGVNTMPTVVFLDAKGKLVLKYEGVLKEDELLKHTEALLK